MILCIKTKQFLFCNSNQKEVIEGEVFERRVMQILSNFSSSEIEEKYLTLEIEGKISDFNNLEGERVSIFYFENGMRIMEKKMIIGKIEELNSRVCIDLWEISFLLNQPLVEYFSKECRANFCDVSCKLKEENFSQDIIIESYSKYNLSIKIRKTQLEEKLFTDGILIYHNKRFLISHIDSGNIFLLSNMADVIFKNGERGILLEGCDKTFNTCQKRFQNNQNFAGEPFIFKTFSKSFFNF